MQLQLCGMTLQHSQACVELAGQRFWGFVPSSYVSTAGLVLMEHRLLQALAAMEKIIPSIQRGFALLCQYLSVQAL